MRGVEAERKSKHKLEHNRLVHDDKSICSGVDTETDKCCGGKEHKFRKLADEVSIDFAHFSYDGCQVLKVGAH